MAKDQRTPIARNFIYVNFERVKSLLSQMNSGSPDTIEQTHGHETGGEVDIEGNVFVAKLSGQGRVMLSSGTTVTRSVYHYVYEEFEGVVKKKGSLKDLNDQFQDESWRNGSARKNLRPGDLFKITTGLSVFDYTYMAETFKSLSDLPDALVGLDQGLRKYLQDLDVTSGIIKSLYPNTISVNIFPVTASSSPYPYLIGRLEPSGLQYSREDLLFLYGLERQIWTTVGIIASVPQPSATVQSGADPTPITKLDQFNVEKIIGQIFSYVVKNNLKYKVEAPSIGVVPLAIYESVY